MKKFGLLLAWLLTFPLAILAQGTSSEAATVQMVDRKFLVVETKDHVKTTYMLSDKPQVTFEGNSLHIVSEKADVTYELLDVLRFTYETQSVTGVSELREEPATIDYNNGELIVSGLKANDAVSIYSMDGKLLVTSVIDNLLKGAVGQAVQNKNLMFGIDETAGLRLKASAF